MGAGVGDGAQTAVDPARAAGAGEDIWVEKQDKTTGKKFYYNRTRRKSAWKPPPGEVVQVGGPVIDP